MFYADLTPFGVDIERLTRDRLARLQAAMKRAKLGALLLADFLNIRYATNTVMMLGLRATGIQRFALIPAEGEPLICQRELSRKKHYRSLRFDAYMFAMRPPIATEDFVRIETTRRRQRARWRGLFESDGGGWLEGSGNSSSRRLAGY